MALRESLMEEVAMCPACGDPIDYCQGHGPIGDAMGYLILRAHDNGFHKHCFADGCDEVFPVFSSPFVE